ncbi:MAG: hypothetical protein JNL38_41515 [Myxococcales bacterium]|nr:hypothetical protein [Myxococcales bacterium]
MKRGIFLLSAAFAPFALFALSPTGCTVLTNDAPLDAGVFEGGEGGPSKACPTCAVQQCTALYATCFDSASCVAIATSLRAPTCDETCDNAAFCAQPQAHVLYRELAACEDAAQCNACQLTCGRKPESCPNPKAAPSPSICGGGVADASAGDSASDAAATDAGPADAAASDAGDAATPAPETCASCVTRCGDAKKACAIGSECDGYLQCAMACTDAACVSQCGVTFASGRQSAKDLARCVRITCGTVCGAAEGDGGI